MFARLCSIVIKLRAEWRNIYGRISNFPGPKYGDIKHYLVSDFFSLRLTAYFRGEPGLVGVYWSKDDGSGGDNWNYNSCKAIQSNRHNQETNTQLFTVRMPFLSPNQQCQSTEEKKTVSDYNKIKQMDTTRNSYTQKSFTICIICVCSCCIFLVSLDGPSGLLCSAFNAGCHCGSLS